MTSMLKKYWWRVKSLEMNLNQLISRKQNNIWLLMNHEEQTISNNPEEVFIVSHQWYEKISINISWRFLKKIKWAKS